VVAERLAIVGLVPDGRSSTVTEDLLISVTTRLEEHLWMLSAQEG
jgi:DNA-binding ferritin-like protein